MAKPKVTPIRPAPQAPQEPSVVDLEANHTGISALCAALFQMENEYASFEGSGTGASFFACKDVNRWVRNAILHDLERLNEEQEQEIRKLKTALEALKPAAAVGGAR